MGCGPSHPIPPAPMLSRPMTHVLGLFQLQVKEIETFCGPAISCTLRLCCLTIEGWWKDCHLSIFSLKQSSSWWPPLLAAAHVQVKTWAFPRLADILVWIPPGIFQIPVGKLLLRSFLGENPFPQRMETLPGQGHFLGKTPFHRGWKHYQDKALLKYNIPSHWVSW